MYGGVHVKDSLRRALTGASLTWPPPHEDRSNQESEGEKQNRD